MTEPLPWTRLYNRVKSQIPAAPDALIREEIGAVVYDFTQETNTWLEEVPVAIVPDVTSYTLTLTGSGKPYRLMIVYNNDPNNSQSRYQWVDNGITMRVPGTIVLYNNPTVAANWIAVVAKQVDDYRMVGTPPVSTGYPEIDDWIIDANQDTMFYGALSYLQRMPSKPWSNPQASAMNAAIYGSQKSNARVNNMRNNVYGAQAWMYPQSFRTIASKKGWT